MKKRRDPTRWSITCWMDDPPRGRHSPAEDPFDRSLDGRRDLASQAKPRLALVLKSQVTRHRTRLPRQWARINRGELHGGGSLSQLLVQIEGCDVRDGRTGCFVPRIDDVEAKSLITTSLAYLMIACRAGLSTIPLTTR